MYLAVYAVQRATDHSFWASALILFLFIFSAPLLLIYSTALSKSPFILFLLGSLLLCSSYCLRPSTKLLVATSLAAGLAIATRYIGITLLPTIVVGMVLFGNNSITQRIRGAFIVVLISCVPISVWVISNLLVTQSAADRSFAFHPIGIEQVKMLMGTLYYFFLPIQSPGWIQALLLSGIAAALLIAVLKISFSSGLSKREPRNFSTRPDFTVFDVFSHLHFLSRNLNLFL